MPGGEGQKPGKRCGSAIEKEIEARRLFMKLQRRRVGEFDDEAHEVTRLAGRPKHVQAPDVAPPRGRDAPAALPEGEARGDDDDPPQRIDRRELQLEAKPGLARTCEGKGSKMTAAMPS